MSTSHLAPRANSGGALPRRRRSARLEPFGFLASPASARIRAYLRELMLLVACFFAATPAFCTSTVTLEWDANPEPDIAGYEVSYGESSGHYSATVNVGNATLADVPGLAEGKTYYFVVTAYNSTGLKSPPSPEISNEAGVLPQKNLAVLYVDSEDRNGYQADYAFDGDPNTFWHTEWKTNAPPPPHELQIDLGAVQNLRGFHYLPRQDNYFDGGISQYELYISPDGINWESPVTSGYFANSKEEKEVLFSPKTGRYVRLRALSEVNGKPFTSVAELTFLLADSSSTEVPNNGPDTISNNAPQALAQSFVTPEDTPLDIRLAGSDIEGSVLSYSIVSQPSHGTLSGTPPNLSYTPQADYNGSDSFTFQVSDGSLGSAAAPVAITITAVDDAPPNTPPAFSSSTIAASATEDSVFSGQLSATDADPGDSLTYSKVSGPQWLSVSPSGQLSGTPLNANVGDNVFMVKATDSAAGTASTMLIVTVANTNDAPVFKLKQLVFPDAAETVAYANQTLAGTATDPDTKDTITYSKTSGPAWLAVAKTGVISGTPPAGSAGTQQFTVRATDPGGAYGETILQIQIVSNLPLPWSVDRIGTTNLLGSAGYSAGNFTIAGAGVLAATQDAANFVWQTMTGDGQMTARVKKLDAGGSTPFVGIMIRESLAANSRMIFVGASSDSDYRWFRRTSTGGTTTKNISKNSAPTSIWLRLVRKSNVVTTYKSSNGTSWTKIGSTTITLPKNCYIGMAVSSGRESILNTSVFSNVSVTP